MSTSNARMRALALVVSLLLAAGCRPGPDPASRAKAVKVLDAAIEAHGGRERLRAFENFHLTSEGSFKGAASFRRTVDYLGPEHWAMTVAFAEGALRLGVDGARCWKEDRYRVEPCADERERRQNAWSGIEHNVWVLATVDPAGVELASASPPAIRSGDLEVVFDPDTHLVKEIRHATRVEVLSDYRTVAGVQVAGRRQVILDGAPDVDERWRDIVPGGAERAAVAAPAVPADGVVRDAVDPTRQVAWVELGDPLADAPGAVERMDRAIHRLGRNPSASDGLIWLPPAAGDSGRWRLAVGIEINAPMAVRESDGVHFETWPPTRELGIYHDGGVLRFDEKRSRLDQLARDRGLSPEDMRLQVLTSREILRAPAGGLSLIRLVPKSADG